MEEPEPGQRERLTADEKACRNSSRSEELEDEHALAPNI